MQKLQLECHRCRQKNVLQGPIECHAKGQGLQTQRPADVADRLIRRISHFHAAIPQANRFLLQGSIAAIPQMQVRQAVWQASRTRGQRKQAAGTQMSQANRPTKGWQATAADAEVVAKAKFDGSRELCMHWLKETPNHQHQSEKHLLPKQHSQRSDSHYNLICDSQLQNTSITHAPAAARNLDAAIPLRSAETELQNAIEVRKAATQICSSKTGARRLSGKTMILKHFVKEI